MDKDACINSSEKFFQKYLYSYIRGKEQDVEAKKKRKRKKKNCNKEYTREIYTSIPFLNRRQMSDSGERVATLASCCVLKV